MENGNLVVWPVGVMVVVTVVFIPVLACIINGFKTLSELTKKRFFADFIWKKINSLYSLYIESFFLNQCQNKTFNSYLLNHLFSFCMILLLIYFKMHYYLSILDQLADLKYYLCGFKLKITIKRLRIKCLIFIEI